ncbi:phytanoyl-CoA dioxygenase family protein [Rhodococcus sp. DMU1]|uniref:phytanoyl-CoA dioxygenase family protein n=1 Tax=Rhodococcus sp. DMU1 TaxID=2722825 RepID=UPI00143EDAD9|nr:phytanoyl-CoA dioxygenase family protein [Rhodococcus sp. DMU1]QIX53851.1 phytanoyl-CoA dioxygenase family protein [Rhodococcus sp. DMU1]
MTFASTLKALDVHNDLLDDREALEDVYRANGYLYFRDVLDRQAVEGVRAKFMSVLADQYGQVDAGAFEPVWNGNDLTDFPGRVPELEGSGIWQDFVAEPAINKFFEKVAGGPVIWNPNMEYRVKPPLAAESEDPLKGRHQDGFYNQGYHFRTCWMPFTEMDASVGGLAIAPGWHTRGFLHDTDAPVPYPIPAGLIPDSDWARADTYRPGDVLMFCDTMPHSGLDNVSDRFRISMDLRFSKIGEDTGVAGEVVEVGEGWFTIDTGSEQVTLRATDQTYLRIFLSDRYEPHQMPDIYPVGTKVLCGRDGDLALVVKKQKL